MAKSSNCRDHSSPPAPQDDKQGDGSNFPGHILMREATYSEFEVAARAAEETLAMNEECFRIFYQRTSRPLWSYLARLSRDQSLADDLVQEAYCRFLANVRPEMSEAHQRNYLFRIATNLLRDHWRQARNEPWTLAEPEKALEIPSPERAAEQAQVRQDLSRALARLSPREHALLWLAYVLGATHKEIAEVLGLKSASIRLLLFRARRKLAGLLRYPLGENSKPANEAAKAREL